MWVMRISWICNVILLPTQKGVLLFVKLEMDFIWYMKLSV